MTNPFKNISPSQVIKTVIAVLLLAAAGYGGYRYIQDQKNRYRQEGYASALQQLVAASDSNKEVNVTVGDKTVKFVVVPTTTDQVPKP